MKNLTQADYIRQPWKNGKGETVELARSEAEDGTLLWRLSMATVAEDGPFSLFPGIARNLTVISGPGFGLMGDGVTLECLPFQPVAFAGDIALSATGTARGASADFNVMTAHHLPRPQVQVIQGGAQFAADGLLALFALESVVVSGVALGRHDLVLTEGPLSLSGAGRVIAVRFAGLPGN